MRLIAIGDVHGHNDTLKELLTFVDPQPDDEIVFLGDLIDRGPDSKGVLSTVLGLYEQCTVRCILGNHEELLICGTQNKSDYRFWMKFGGKECLASYGINPLRQTKLELSQLPPEHVQLIGAMLDYYETDRFIFVHACYHPNVPMSGQSRDNLRWVSPPPGLPPHFSGKRVYCGHVASGEICDRGHLVCVDTGCGVRPDGKLTAVDVLTDTVWQVICS